MKPMSRFDYERETIRLIRSERSVTRARHRIGGRGKASLLPAL